MILVRYNKAALPALSPCTAISRLQFLICGVFIDHDACHDLEYVQVILTAKFHYPGAADQATHDASRRHGDSVQVRKGCEK